MSELSAADRLALVDVSNRINLAFDDWDTSTLTDLMDPRLRMSHPRGDVVGLDGFAAFLRAYRPLTVGCRRHALNHVVTGNDDGTATVTSYLLILRVTRAAVAQGAAVLPAEPGLPAVVLSSRVTDTFRRGDRGWRLWRRSIDGIVETSDAEVGNR